jgi:hypothetical protein
MEKPIFAVLKLLPEAAGLCSVSGITDDLSLRIFETLIDRLRPVGGVTEDPIIEVAVLSKSLLDAATLCSADGDTDISFEVFEPLDDVE